MAIIDKSGTNIGSAFKLVSPNPLDVRLIADDETDLQSLIDNKAVYAGMIVWVKSLEKHKKYNGTEFVDFECISEERVNELIDLKITGWLGGES